MAREQQRRRNPFRGLVDLNSEMARMSDRMAGVDAGQVTETHPRSYADAWTPATDIFAYGDDLVIRVELSGVTREEVDVTFSNGTLALSGQRQSNEEDAAAVYYTKERGWGHFRRSITLPEGVDEDDIVADLDHGLLEVTVRGGAAVRGPAQIEVTTSRGRG